MANTEAIARLEEQLSHVAGEFNRIEEVVKETINEPSLEYPTLKVQTEKGETTDILFPNSSSLATKPFILDNQSSHAFIIQSSSPRVISATFSNCSFR